MASNPNDGEAEPCCYSNSTGTLCPSIQGGAAVGFGEQVEKKRLWASGWSWKPLSYNPGLGAWGRAGEDGWPSSDKGYGPLRVGSSSEQGGQIVQPSVGVQLRKGVVQFSDRVQVRLSNTPWESFRLESGPAQYWCPAQTGRSPSPEQGFNSE